MKFRFKKIGPVKNAQLELGDFTLIAGRNNTGKTYLVYALYGFLKTWEEGLLMMGSRLLQRRRPVVRNGKQTPSLDFRRIAKELLAEGHARRSINRKTLKQDREILINNLTRYFSIETLAGVFSSPHDDFSGASIEVGFDVAFPEKMETISIGVPTTGDIFLIEYDGEKLIMSRGALGKRPLRSMHIERYLPRLYYKLLLPEFPSPFILCAERFGISLFYKELDFTKNRLVEELQNTRDNKKLSLSRLMRLRDEIAGRYALPVRDNIDYTRSISDISKRKSEVSGDKLFDRIKDMMGGYYRSSRDEIRFKSKARGEKGFDIPLHLASSSARGMSDLYFFLRHHAHKKELLIIDEPESHLDTANQRLLARLLSYCVRAGLKVLVTTHSDYLIKEINNLIMLSHSFPGKGIVAKKLGYKESDFLHPENIRAYIAENNGLTVCEIDEFGIDMPIFDETIDDINEVSNTLVSCLEDAEEK